MNGVACVDFVLFILEAISAILRLFYEAMLYFCLLIEQQLRLQRGKLFRTVTFEDKNIDKKFLA
jgi:hypothetical protein